MNARQKAKKYKKLYEEYKADADSWKRYARTEAAKHHETAAKVKTIHFIKLIPNEAFLKVPKEIIEKEIVESLGQTICDEKLIRWKKEDVDEMCCVRISGELDVLSQEEKG